MTNQQFSNACNKLLRILQDKAPKRTGNLAYNACRLEIISPNEAWLYVDESVAPYMPYTNEPWISPNRHGKKNPNEGWFDRTADYIASEFARIAKGEKDVDD